MDEQYELPLVTPGPCLGQAMPQSSEPTTSPISATPDAKPDTAIAEPIEAAKTGLGWKGARPQHSVLAGVTVPSGAERPATLQDCLAYIHAHGELAPSQSAAMQGAVNRVAKIVQTGCTPWSGSAASTLPADPDQLRPILNSVLPAGHGLSKKRWSNIRSSITSLLLCCGWVPAEARHGTPLTGAWAEIFDLSRPDHGGSVLGPFARYCHARAITPEEVTGEVLQAFETWRRTESLVRYPRAAALSVRTSWNQLVEEHPDRRLSAIALESQVIWKATRIETLPTMFGAELGAYLHQLRHPDRFNPRHGRRYSEQSVQHARRGLLRAAAYLIQAGTPREAIKSLADLTTPPAYRTILEQLDAEREQDGDPDAWSSMSVVISASLINLARRWGDIPSDQLDQIEALHRLVKPRRPGLSRRVRNRLAQFGSDEERRALFELPGRACDEAVKHLKAAQRAATQDNKGYRAAKLHETAVALALLLTQPLRRADLARLDIEQHIERDRKGRPRRIVIQMQKTHREIDATLPPDISALVEHHIRVFRPLLPGANIGSALFPSKNRCHRAPDTLGRQLTKLVEKQLGARFSAHLARHLAAEMLLDADPNNLVVVQRLLGHARRTQTQDLYGVTRTSAAQKSYAAVVDSMRGAPPRRAKKAEERRR